MNFIQTVLLVEKRIGLVEEQVRLLSRKWNNPSKKREMYAPSGLTEKVVFDKVPTPTQAL